MKENYTQVNINEWSRGNLFKSYMDNMRIVMSLTVDILSLIHISEPTRP